MTNLIRVNSRKFNRQIHRSWDCELIQETADFWLLYGIFSNSFSHPELGFIAEGTFSFEYYFKAKWYNIFLFYEPDGKFKFYYCNVNMPPIFEHQTLDYVDLDLDILVDGKFNFNILDQEEFQENQQNYQYPAETVEKAKSSLDELIEIIENRQFPFSVNVGTLFNEFKV